VPVLVPDEHRKRSYSVALGLTRIRTKLCDLRESARNHSTSSSFFEGLIISRSWSRRPRRNGSYERRRFLVRARVTLSTGDGGWHKYGTPLRCSPVIVQCFRAFLRLDSRTENPRVVGRGTRVNLARV
jgi:hypothetical protein